MDSPWPHTS